MPDPDFYGGGLDTGAWDCGGNLGYFDSTNNKWNCPWDVNSKSNWLKTDGINLVIDTSLATASLTVYEVSTCNTLWCACTDSTFAYQNI
jgi:hypothetical protein